MISASGYVWVDNNILSTLPQDLSSLRDFRPPTNCQVFDASGALVDEFYVERRIWVSLAEMPSFVGQAFIAAEDRRFYTHRGVDFFGILRALWVNLTRRGTRQGGSTITQQLVKNLLVGKERSYRRKIREAVLAWRLEKDLSKDEILELYLNYVYLGSGNYGVEAAARDYFGVSVGALDPGQAALLAGLVPAPSRYSPRASREQAAQRRRYVFSRMLEDGYLSAEEVDWYQKSPVLLPREDKAVRRTGIAYVTRARREIRNVYGTELAATQGLRVYTPMDLAVQTVAEAAVKDVLQSHQLRQGGVGIMRRLAIEERTPFLQRATGLERNMGTGEWIAPQPKDCFEAMVPDDKDLATLRAGPFSFALADEDRSLSSGTKWLTVATSTAPDAPRVRSSSASLTLAQVVQGGDVLRVCLTQPGQVRLDPRPWAEGAAVVLENRSGRVIALVGGWESTLEGFNRATQARRQPGSSMKPYVYAAALLAGRTQADIVVDAPIDLPAGGGKRWRPKNYDGRYFGPVSLRTAFAKSLNTVAVRLTMDVGADQVAQLARVMGVETPLRSDLTLALGSSEVTLLDQVLGYATIARMGVPATPVFIDRVQDNNGQQMGIAGGPEQGGWPALPGGPQKRALPAGVAYAMADMMREVVVSGTARRAYRPGLDRAGKTGTTNGYVDAWFIGFSPEYTVGVWVGTDGTRSLGEGETGGRAALPAWIKIMDILPATEGATFAVPEGAMVLPVEGRWLGFARGSVPERWLPRPTLGDEPLPPVPPRRAKKYR